MDRPGHILIVDDDRDLRESLAVMLAAHGFLVRTAADGDQALAALTAECPDLLLLDVMMRTDTEGFDLACQLKGMPAFADLPIVIMTSFLEKVREEGPDRFLHIAGEEWPACWFFEKPVDVKKLLAKIEGVLGSRSA